MQLALTKTTLAQNQSLINEMSYFGSSLGDMHEKDNNVLLS
jgi:hypothetical protein